MPVRSNLPAVLRSTTQLGQALSLRSRGPGGRRLGDEAADVIAAGIRTRTVDEQEDANGAPLAPLARSTILRKARKGLPATIGVETGGMLDVQELRGRVTVLSDRVVQDYGIDPESEQKAAWFSEGGPGRPERPFYALDDDTEKALDTLAKETLDAAIRRL